jgi:predicted nucleic acid-binding protein
VRKLFADAFFLIALLNTRDSWHQEVRRKERQLGDHCLLFVTHEVLLEVLASFAQDRRMRVAAAQLVRHIKLNRGHLHYRLLLPSESLFDRGLDRYERRPDKSYSLTDCISMVVMEEEGINEVLSNDHHFEQEGFTILFKR